MEVKRFNRIKTVLTETVKPDGKNWTGNDLAKALGIGHLTVSRWSRNVRQPDLETLFKIAEVLGVDPCDLLDRREKSEPISEDENASL